MSDSIRNSKALQLFCALIALYVLHYGTDGTAAYRDGVWDNATLNHPQSVTALILEQIFGLENEFPDCDEYDSETNTALEKSGAADLFLVPAHVLKIHLFLPLSTIKEIGFCKTPRLQAYFEIHSPPPEV